MPTDLGGKAPQWLGPAGLHHAEQLAVPLAQREDSPGATRRPGDRGVISFGTARVAP